MKKTLPVQLFFLAIILFIASACSAQDKVEKALPRLEIYENIDSEIALRPWETQGLGKVIGKETLTVMKSRDGTGDMVVLHWSENKAQFKSEVYRRQLGDDHASWLLVSENEEKTLTYQYDNLYMIHQLIAGKEGGQKTQLFRLQKP